jgi:hypothetical protein
MLAQNMYSICKYQNIFNGRRIFMVVEGEGLIDKTPVSWMLMDTHKVEGFEFESAENIDDAFVKMLDMVQSTDPDEATFFAHTNGTEDEDTPLEELSVWTEALYKNNLSDPAMIDIILRNHPCAGAFRHSGDPWGFGSNFFWFNHLAFFTPGWKKEIGTVADCIGKKFSYGDAYSFDLIRLCQAPNSFDPSKVSIVTTCKNRWEFLKQSLPTWLGRGFYQIVIVDWSSDDPIASKIAEMPDGDTPVTVIRIEGEEIFNGGMARNQGSLEVPSEYIMFIDSDMKIKDWSKSEAIKMVPGRFYHGPHNVPPFGTCVVRKWDFEAINGFSELYPAYGWEDNDLYNRLDELGLRRSFYDERMVEHIDHSDELRAEHRDQRGMELHETVWANKELEKWTPDHVRAYKDFTLHRFSL